MKYEKDYVCYDEFGIVSVNCMCCDVAIIVRDYIRLPSHSEPGKYENVMVMKKLSNHTELKVEMSNGSYAHLPHCTDCAKEPLDAEKATSSMHRGWKQEMVYAGRSEEHMAMMTKGSRHLKIKSKHVEVI